MFKLLKIIKWDMQTKSGKFYYKWYLVKNIPGLLGIEIRKRFLTKHLKNVGENLEVHEGVYIRNVNKLSIGDNVGIGVDSFIQAAGRVTIGNNVMFGPGVKIWSANHRFADPNKPISEQGYDFAEVIIGDNVWIGANSFIMPGSKIGDGVVISAGSVVGGREIPPFIILAGNPARKIGDRKKG